MKYSILVPVYNVEEYLPACLDSLLAQTFQDFEIICINDGSTDTSPAICDTYQQAHPDKIKVTHKANEGLISARRISIKQAQGEYLCFVDSDDLIVPTYLEKLNNAIESTQTDMVIFGFNRINESDEVTASFLPPLEERVYRSAEDLMEIRSVIMTSNDLNSLCFKCTRTTLFDRDVDYSPFYQVKNTEDLLQSLPLFDQAKTITAIHDYLYSYRTNTESMTREVMTVAKLESMILVYDELEEYAKRWGFSGQVYQARFYLILKSATQNLIGNWFSKKRQIKTERNALISRLLEDDTQKRALLCKHPTFTTPWLICRIWASNSNFVIRTGICTIAVARYIQKKRIQKNKDKTL